MSEINKFHDTNVVLNGTFNLRLDLEGKMITHISTSSVKKGMTVIGTGILDNTKVEDIYEHGTQNNGVIKIDIGTTEN